jgi:hypothetical protein
LLIHFPENAELLEEYRDARNVDFGVANLLETDDATTLKSKKKATTKQWTQKTLFSRIESADLHKYLDMLNTEPLPLRHDHPLINASPSDMKIGYYTFLAFMHRFITANPQCFPDDEPANPGYVHTSENWFRSYSLLRYYHRISSDARAKTKAQQRTTANLTAIEMVYAKVVTGEQPVWGSSGVDDEDGEKEEADELDEYDHGHFPHESDDGAEDSDRLDKPDRHVLGAIESAAMKSTSGGNILAMRTPVQSAFKKFVGETSARIERGILHGETFDGSEMSEAEQARFWEVQDMVSAVSAKAPGYLKSCEILGADPEARRISDDKDDAVFQPWQIIGRLVDCSPQGAG